MDAVIRSWAQEQLEAMPEPFVRWSGSGPFWCVRCGESLSRCAASGCPESVWRGNVAIFEWRESDPFVDATEYDVHNFYGRCVLLPRTARSITLNAT